MPLWSFLSQTRLTKPGPTIRAMVKEVEQETQDKLAQGQAILVDVRSKTSYDKSHAEGAISVPEDEIGARQNELPRDKDLILYCT